VVTLPSTANVDRREDLEPLVQQLGRSVAQLPLVFAVHPRTRKKLVEFGLMEALSHPAGKGGQRPG